MTKTGIIHDVIKIILKHAKPHRIYLYGSQVNGEATATSDIDIAFDDPNFKTTSVIRDEVEKLSTLIKIDVTNLAHAEKRFQNRVKSTGRVLYSSDKKLRAEDGLYNFAKALSAFDDIINRKDEIYEAGFSDIYLDLIVKRFEFTFEMSWKTLKRYLAFLGVDARNPSSCFKEAFEQGLISDEDSWLSMMNMRNLSSHIYDESEIAEILEKVFAYRDCFVALETKLKKALIQHGK